MDAEDEIVVSLESEATPAAKEVEAPDPAILELKKQYEATLAEDRQRADAAERRAATERQAREEAERQAQEAQTQVADSQLGTVESGLAAAQTDADAAQGDYERAMEAGDWKAAGAAQRKLTEAVSRAGRLAEAKSDLEARKTEAPAKRTEQRPERPSDPIEAYIHGRTEPTAEWLRAHKEFITDPRKNAKLTGAHYDAVGEGLQPDTPEYFAHVETVLGLKKAEPARETNGRFQPQPRRPSVPAAPVSASSGGTNGGGAEVRLSKGEAAAANDGTVVWGKHDLAAGRLKDPTLLGKAIGNQEFARRKKIMTEQGLYDKSLTEQ